MHAANSFNMASFLKEGGTAIKYTLNIKKV
jgi:hypothetical protein